MSGFMLALACPPCGHPSLSQGGRTRMHSLMAAGQKLHATSTVHLRMCGWLQSPDDAQQSQ